MYEHYSCYALARALSAAEMELIHQLQPSLEDGLALGSDYRLCVPQRTWGISFARQRARSEGAAWDTRDRGDAATARDTREGGGGGSARSGAHSRALSPPRSCALSRTWVKLHSMYR